MSFDVRSMPGGLILGERRTFTLRHPYPALYWRGQEPITFIRTEVRHQHGPAGYVLEWQVDGQEWRPVGWFGFSSHADHAEWEAWTWMLSSGGPPPPEDQAFRVVMRRLSAAAPVQAETGHADRLPRYHPLWVGLAMSLLLLCVIAAFILAAVGQLATVFP